VRPGELVAGSGPVPAASPSRRERVPVRNKGRFVAYLGSHFDLSRASAALEFDRRAATGARIDLRSGATIRIAAGETIELDLIWD
jgi:urease beta subunit